MPPAKRSHGKWDVVELQKRAGVFFVLIVGLLVPMWMSPWYCHVVLCAFVAGGSLEFWIAVCNNAVGLQGYLEMVVIFLAWCLPTIAALQFYESMLGHKRLVECLVIQLVVGDSAQMLVGRSIGRHFVCPTLSPKKTFEGYFGGAVVTLLYASVAHGWSITDVLVAYGFGCIGDLYFSAVKRRLGIKDYSRVLSSHGGLLDRIDSFMFAANALVWKAAIFTSDALCPARRIALQSWGRAPSLAKRFERLSMKESSLLENMKHVLVAYSVQFANDETLAASLFAAEASTGVGKDPRVRWPPLAESVGAVVYHCDPEQQASSKMSGGSLLRLFRSEYFDAHLHMHYLLRMEQSGVQDYLVNELYKMTDDDVDYYLPQLSQVALLRYNKSSLHRFLLDKAAQSMPFALKIHWLVRSIVEDRTPELYENAMAMLSLCEAAMVNSSSSSRKREEEASPGPPQVQRILRSSSDPDLQSNRAPSVEEFDEPEQRAPKRRSRTPGPMRSREADGIVHPDDSEGPEHCEVRFNPPTRQISGESSLDDPTAESETPLAGLLSEAEALRAAAVRHLAALEQAFNPEERTEASELPASCPNAFQTLGLPIATGHPHEEDGLDDERARECSLEQINGFFPECVAKNSRL
eukprot:symbB.v1.2.030882.t1/scaffold3459.1/size56318/5